MAHTEPGMGPKLWGRTTDMVSFTPNLVNFKHFVLIQKANDKVGFSTEGITDMSLW